jgi:hypothetical protein
VFSIAFPSSRSNLVTTTNFEDVEVEGTGWDAHVGGDVSDLFSRVFGLGGVALYPWHGNPIRQATLARMMARVTVPVP